MTYSREDALNPKPRTVEQVQDTLKHARLHGDAGADISFARLMVKHGNLTEDARAFAAEYLRRQTA